MDWSTRQDLFSAVVKHNNMPFITFEGTEGGGKSTQISRLKARLEAAGYEVIQLREPGGTPLGESIRHLLKHAPEGRGMPALTELLLFSASRVQLIEAVIQPALAAGKWVLCDRFVDSTTVYQGEARRIEGETIATINKLVVGSCMPELTLLLDVHPDVSAARLKARNETKDRLEEEGREFFLRVQHGYRLLAHNNQERVVTIDASQPVEVVEAAIWASVSQKFKV